MNFMAKQISKEKSEREVLARKILRILGQWIAMGVNAKIVMSVPLRIARYAIEQSLRTKAMKICII